MGISIIINEPEVRYTNTAAYAASATYATYAKTSEYATYTFHALTADAALEADEADLAGEVPFDSCCIKPDIDQEPHVVEPPVFSPPSGHYEIAQFIQIATPTEGASIRYGPGGSIANTYTGGWTLGTDMRYSAQAYKVGWISSGVVTASYTFGGAPPPPPEQQHDAYLQIVDTCLPTSASAMVGIGNSHMEPWLAASIISTYGSDPRSWTYGAIAVNYLTLTPELSTSCRHEYEMSIYTSSNPYGSGGQWSYYVNPGDYSLINSGEPKLQLHAIYTTSDPNIENTKNAYYKHELIGGYWATGSCVIPLCPAGRYYIYTRGKFAQSSQLYAQTSSYIYKSCAATMSCVSTDCLVGSGGCQFLISNGSQKCYVSYMTLSNTSTPPYFGSCNDPQTVQMGAAVPFGGPMPKGMTNLEEEELFRLAIENDIIEMNLHKDIREIKCNKKYIKADGQDYCELSITTNNKETLWVINNKTYMIKNTDNISRIIIKSKIKTTILINITDINIIYNNITVNFI